MGSAVSIFLNRQQHGDRKSQLQLCFLLAIFLHLMVAAASSPLLYSQLDGKFCEISYHSSILIGTDLYVNNGNLDYGDGNVQTASSLWNQQPFLETRVVDMSVSWNTSTGPYLKQTIPQGEPNFPPARYCGSALWQNDSNLAVYGGDRLSSVVVSPILPPQIYMYDTTVGNWSTTIRNSDMPSLDARACGSYAQSRDIGYYLGGYHGPDSEPVVNSDPSDTFMRNNMVQVNFKNGQVNSTQLPDTYPTNAGGALVYIEAVGEKGILVALGGVSYAEDVEFNEGVLQNPSADSYTPMNEMSIFDIDSQTWLMQKVPSAITLGVQTRVDFCTVLVSAQDNSSHHIYMFGGHNATGFFENIWVLSLPTFEWTLVSSHDINVARWGHTCNLVGYRQMLVLGGIQFDINDQDVQYPQQINRCGNETLYRVFDLTLHQWTDQFNVDAKPYELNENLVKLVGGSPTGGATKTAPSTGWSDPRLQSIFERSKTSNALPNSNPTRSGASPLRSKNLQYIIAASILGVFILFLVILIAWLLHKRRRAHARLCHNKTRQTQLKGSESSVSFISDPHNPSLSNATRSNTNAEDIKKDNNNNSKSLFTDTQEYGKTDIAQLSGRERLLESYGTPPSELSSIDGRSVELPGYEHRTYYDIRMQFVGPAYRQ